jgi:hypothetical protein
MRGPAEGQENQAPQRPTSQPTRPPAMRSQKNRHKEVRSRQRRLTTPRAKEIQVLG